MRTSIATAICISLASVASAAGAAGKPTILLAQNLDTRGTTPSTQRDDASGLEEVIVTANRREQNIQEVAASIQVLDGDALAQRGANDFEDYLSGISGVGMTRSGSGSVKAGVRGVSNVIGGESGVGDSTSAVGLYLNDVPIQGSGPLPDLALYDVQRIEVLKGPQGTLYGEGAMGGAIKMILNPPDTAAFATRTEAGVSVTENGGVNYEVKGAVNLPLLEDRMAARLVASYRDDSGFIDNIRTGEDDINSSTTINVRGQLSWKLTDAFSAEALALHQKFDQDDFDEMVAGAGDLQSTLAEERYNNVNFDLFALTLKYDFGGAQLVSSSSYWENDRERFDRAPTVGYFLNFTLDPFGLPLVSPSDAQGFTLLLDQHAFTQELRVSSTGDDRFDWTVGAFYRSAKQSSTGYDTVVDLQAVNTAILASGLPPGAAFDSSYVFASKVDEAFKQTALFGEVDVGLTERLDLKLGVRWFEEDLEQYQRDEGLNLVAMDLEFLGIANPSIRSVDAKDDDVIGRIGLSYRLSDDEMIYTLVGQGFRSGGPNFSGGLSGTTVPDLFKSDSLINYEIGAKTAWLDGRLIANASLYYIDWSDVQVRVSDVETSYIGNAGEAEVRGGELQLIASPTERWQLGLNLGLLRSEITGLAPGVSGRVGSDLPNAPETTGSAYVQYSWPLGAWGEAHARADYLYVDEQTIELLPPTGPTEDYYLDAYQTGRVQIGVENERWGAFLYADNLWDERAATSKRRINPPQEVEQRLSVIRPRTLGMRFQLSF
jgi:iron complex outermembrane recepter protein